MVIDKLKSKKKLIISSISLTILGFIISFIGFVTLGFDLTKFETSGEYKWYRTINFGQDKSFEFDILDIKE